MGITELSFKKNMYIFQDLQKKLLLFNLILISGCFFLLQKTGKVFEFQKYSNVFKGSHSTRLLCIWIFVGERNGIFCYSVFKIYDFTRYVTS